MSKRATVRLEHRAFGWGVVKRSRYTDLGNEVLDVRFEDKDRTVLAAPEFWQSSQAEVEQAFAELLEVKPDVRIPQGVRQQCRDRALPTPMYEITDDGDTHIDLGVQESSTENVA